MIKVHYLNESRAHRVVWLLEELGAPYEIVRYQRDKKTRRAPSELKAIHPLGKSPVIEDGARIIAESAAILEYLAERYGAGRFMPPRESASFLDYRYWMHYAEGSAMPILFLKYVLMVLPSRTPFFVRPIVAGVLKQAQKQFTDPQMVMHFDFWEETLLRQPWFAGSDFTAADIQMSYPVEAGITRLGVRKSYPAVNRFIERIAARPAYVRAREAVGESAP